jgi:hypothetical protein
MDLRNVVSCRRYLTVCHKPETLHRFSEMVCCVIVLLAVFRTPILIRIRIQIDPHTDSLGSTFGIRISDPDAWKLVWRAKFADRQYLSLKKLGNTNIFSYYIYYKGSRQSQLDFSLNIA